MHDRSTLERMKHLIKRKFKNVMNAFERQISSKKMEFWNKTNISSVVSHFELNPFSCPSFLDFRIITSVLTRSSKAHMYSRNALEC